mmetsp:Transcript_5243/g.16166  ORF Transcript_5243/g.16166 Transcript_5243/m.16166 type:complete len:83 (-) Transcript_5243:1249-1497(-)
MPGKGLEEPAMRLGTRDSPAAGCSPLAEPAGPRVRSPSPMHSLALSTLCLIEDEILRKAALFISCLSWKAIWFLHAEKRISL